mgnify:CR=1 FL=1
MTTQTRIIDAHNHIGVELLFYLHGDYPYGQDLCSMIENRAAEPITDWIVFPFVTNQSFSTAAMREGRIEVSPEAPVPYAFENRRLLQEVHDYFPEYTQKVIPFVMLDPARRVPEQVEALRSLRNEYAFSGFKIQATIIQSPIRSLMDNGAPLLDLAREWHLPFTIHSSIAENDPWSPCSDILDIAEANQDVHFCLAHSCRFDLPSLERLASLPNVWFDCSAHRIHCESVLRNLPNIATPSRRFPSDYRDPARVLADLHEAFPGKLIWGSDSPFYSWITSSGRLPFKLKSSYKAESDCLLAQDPNVIQDIACKHTLQYIHYA